MQTLVTIQEQTIMLLFPMNTILLNKLGQTNVMVSALSMKFAFADFRPVFRVTVSNTVHRR